MCGLHAEIVCARADSATEMNRDVEELPLIIGDLENGVRVIQEKL